MLNIFKKKQPTVAEVQAEIEKLKQQRQAIATRQAQIEQELVSAYGTDTDISALLEESYKLEQQLKSFSGVSSELGKALVSAQLDEYLKEYESVLKQASDSHKATLAIEPELIKRRAAYIELRDKDAQLRAQTNSLKYKASNMLSLPNLNQSGLDVQEIVRGAEAIRAKYPHILEADIADTYEQKATIIENKIMRNYSEKG